MTVEDVIISDEWVEAKLFGSILAKFIDSFFVSDKVSITQEANPLGFKFFYNPDKADNTTPFPANQTALIINRWIGRFGNNVLQLRCAYLIAKLLGANTIVAPTNEFFKTSRTNGIDFQFGLTEQDSTAVAIVGEFFPIPFKNYHQIFGEKNIADFYNDFKGCLTLNPVAGLTERDLVLFIRSGDIFSINEDFIRGYGQPPLSFYEKVIDIEQPDRIYVMAEDRSSPIVDRLLAPRRQNIELVQRGMRGDFEFMLGAKKIACGTTTLIPNLLNCSNEITHCYSFENGLRSFDGTFTNTVLKDADGYYRNKILSNNWIHSAEQLTLMVEYPEYHIVVS